MTEPRVDRWHPSDLGKLYNRERLMALELAASRARPVEHVVVATERQPLPPAFRQHGQWP